MSNFRFDLFEINELCLRQRGARKTSAALASFFGREFTPLALRVHISPDERNATFFIDGMFEFALHRPFLDGLKKCKQVPNFLVDLEGCAGMDSSALGMLLMLADQAGTAEKIEVVNASPEIRKVFKIIEKTFPVRLR